MWSRSEKYVCWYLELNPNLLLLYYLFYHFFIISKIFLYQVKQLRNASSKYHAKLSNTTSIKKHGHQPFICTVTGKYHLGSELLWSSKSTKSYLQILIALGDGDSQLIKARKRYFGQNERSWPVANRKTTCSRGVQEGPLITLAPCSGSPLPYANNISEGTDVVPTSFLVTSCLRLCPLVHLEHSSMGQK